MRSRCRRWCWQYAASRTRSRGRESANRLEPVPGRTRLDMRRCRFFRNLSISASDCTTWPRETLTNTVPGRIQDSSWAPNMPSGRRSVRHKAHDNIGNAHHVLERCHCEVKCRCQFTRQIGIVEQYIDAKRHQKFDESACDVAFRRFSSDGSARKITHHLKIGLSCALRAGAPLLIAVINRRWCAPNFLQGSSSSSPKPTPKPAGSRRESCQLL